MTDNIFDALSNGYRRRLLVDLLSENPQSVSKQSTGREEWNQFEKAMVNARHIHLPKLSEYGFIDWNRDQQLVTKGARFDEIKPMLELLHDNRDQLPVDWL